MDSFWDESYEYLNNSNKEEMLVITRPPTPSSFFSFLFYNPILFTEVVSSALINQILSTLMLISNTDFTLYLSNIHESLYT